MELRHLRYFVAVAEEGSVTLAAARRLHTAQPSLSRQLRDLEREVGVQLLLRTVRGIELTAAGQAFLDHARLALSQVEAAGEAARRAAHPAKEQFVMGFLTGTEIDCPSCNGTGFPTVVQPNQPGRKIFPARCKQCSGKGRIGSTAVAR